MRVARAARALGISPVGVASEADRGAGWLDIMDEYVVLGPSAPRESYLRGDAIVQAARQTGCSAVHPGWGFLAENPSFAALAEQHGLTFVGPSASVMERMGLKWPAKRAMSEAGLPGIPGSPGLLTDADEAVRVAAEVGYPVILKADAGGGGRGMRLCPEESEVPGAYAAASAEAAAAFGDGSLYLEKYIEGGRHVEVQLVADAFGNCIHLFERDCSVQRKHQKLIEESPCPLLDDAARRELGEASARAAAAIGYRGAGTIEFLRRPDDGTLCFMEMNTRLQVEHPVTELVTGLDVVELQLRAAANQPLPLRQEDVRLEGHAIECRINAEDPSRDFQPSPGRIEAFEFPEDLGPGTIRVDTHLQAGDSVPPYYDSLVAKVLAHGEDRAAAIETMLRALRAARVEGVATTIPLHLAVLESEAFRTSQFDTRTIPGWPKP